MNYICNECQKLTPVTTLMPTCECGGLFSLDFTPRPFSDKLIDKNCHGVFRYREFMPLIGESYKSVTLGEGFTPIIELEKDVLLKLDYFMPTLSFKDRGAAVLISHCKDIGVNSVIQDSSGNAGNSVAAYGARAGMNCEIFVPEGTSEKKIAMIKSHGANVTIVEGSRDNCANKCRQKVVDTKSYYASHVYNPYFYEGTKTYIYEVLEQLGRIPKNIFVPLGNGTLFIGVLKALEHLMESKVIEKMPNVIAVQSERCAPFVASVKENSKLPLLIKPTPTLAEGIAIGEPKRGKQILELIYKYNVELIEIPEEGILSAQDKLAKQGVFCEHTTAATYAAYLSHKARNPELEDSLIPICGAGLKSMKG